MSLVNNCTNPLSFAVVCKPLFWNVKWWINFTLYDLVTMGSAHEREAGSLLPCGPHVNMHYEMDAAGIWTSLQTQSPWHSSWTTSFACCTSQALIFEIHCLHWLLGIMVGSGNVFRICFHSMSEYIFHFIIFFKVYNFILGCICVSMSVYAAYVFMVTYACMYILLSIRCLPQHLFVGGRVDVGWGHRIVFVIVFGFSDFCICKIKKNSSQKRINFSWSCLIKGEFDCCWCMDLSGVILQPIIMIKVTETFLWLNWNRTQTVKCYDMSIFKLFCTFQCLNFLLCWFSVESRHTEVLWISDTSCVEMMSKHQRQSAQG